MAHQQLPALLAQQPVHSLGPECGLTPVTQPPQGDELLGISPIKSQFFYSSTIPIDDPLSSATIPASSEARSSKLPLRPFSERDNIALEKAWLSLVDDDARRNHVRAQRNRSPSPLLASKNAARLASLVDQMARKHEQKHAHEPRSLKPTEGGSDSLPGAGTPVCCPELSEDTSNGLRQAFCSVIRKTQSELDQQRVIAGVMLELQRSRAVAVERGYGRLRQNSATAPSPRSAGFPLSKDSHLPMASVRPGSAASETDPNQKVEGKISSPAINREASETSQSRRSTIGNNPPLFRATPLDDGISGKPFVRVETSDGFSQAPSEPLVRSRTPRVEDKANDEIAEPLTGSVPHEDGNNGITTSARTGGLADVTMGSVEVPVGVSRLHMVSIPGLLMKPIYWSPVGDISIVMRATWFYRDTMVPVEAAVANRLEAGYRELRPYTQTWNDELKCAVEVGPLGEEKVSYPLWPSDAPHGTKSRTTPEPEISHDPFCAARCFRGEAAAEGILEPVGSGRDPAKAYTTTKMYSNHHVIYQDETTAFLLKPSLKPSAYYGRKPVAKILKGMTLGIPVIRGFDRLAWDRIHEKKHKPPPSKTIPVSHGQTASAGFRSRSCPACEAEDGRGPVRDLVLITHGIGQKFAERVESYHFTHAITAFRRAINIELRNETVHSVLRDEFNGIMVLPVNWRHNLSFEDGGPLKEEDQAAHAADGFGLKDIEPNTIPAVRSMISDIMFDIPFYMSHHKPKMIQALVGEANRIYRLWCRNNPGFAENGRIHLIAHSLGSAMAIEVLSKQPTKAPALSLIRELPATSFFEFDVTNLILLGSPAGFFLLLERGQLTPRYGRRKPGADPSDTVAHDIVGEAGSFGCLAVDNVYNILAREDPIAYLLNGTIDPVYASSVKVAYVPSSTTSILRAIGDTMRGIVPVASAVATEVSGPAMVKPPVMRLPSQLELEVHDFTREEIAEKKAYLLNDNGQIDYFLHSGGGPLEIQYLNMLSAHSIYWTHQDLIRLLCMEIGRRPGRAHTLPAMRAVKCSKRIVPPRK